MTCPRIFIGCFHMRTPLISPRKYLLPALPKQKLEGEERAVGPRTELLVATRVKSMSSCEWEVRGVDG